MNKMTESNCRIGYTKSQARILKVLQKKINSHQATEYANELYDISECHRIQSSNHSVEYSNACWDNDGNIVVQSQDYW